MSTGGQCPHCGGTDVEMGHGEMVCTNCGFVLEAQQIVSEVQFEETQGCTRALGQLVTDDGQHVGGGAIHSSLRNLGRDSKIVTQQRARLKLQELGEQLRLSSPVVNMALQFYKMALSQRLTRGRKFGLTLGACIYMACRSQGTNHMLLDISDALEESVYILGRVYFQIANALNISVPAVDPSIFIERFACNLGFGEKTHMVCLTALRLIQRMKRDWIHAGRKPSGLCGAALLIAARLHNFSRTTKDIVKVVGASESTLNKRLMEFKETPSSGLSLQDFFTVDFSEEQDPPSFTRSLQAANPAAAAEEAKSVELMELQRQIDQALDQKSKHPFNITEEELDQLDPGQAHVVKEVRQITAASLGITASIDELLGIVSAKVQIDDIPSRDKDLLLNMAGFGDEDMATQNGTEDAINDELDLTGIDDEELEEECLLTTDEIRQKHSFWSKVNDQYLREREEREKKKKQEEEEAAQKPKVPKKKRLRKKDLAEAANAGEAIQKMLRTKKISMDCDILRNIEPRNTSRRRKPQMPTCSNMTLLKDKMNLLRKSLAEESSQESIELSGQDAECILEEQEEEGTGLASGCVAAEPDENIKMEDTEEEEEEEEPELSSQDLLNAHRGISSTTVVVDYVVEECYEDFDQF